jgi:hypothetical protein
VGSINLSQAEGNQPKVKSSFSKGKLNLETNPIMMTEECEDDYDEDDSPSVLASKFGAYKKKKANKLTFD